MNRLVRFAFALLFAVPLLSHAQGLEKVSLRLDWVNSGYHATESRPVGAFAQQLAVAPIDMECDTR